MGYQFSELKLSKFQSMRKCLAVFLAIILGCCVGLAGFYLIAWQLADPGCHCLAERLALARRAVQRLWYLAYLIGIIGAVVFAGLVLWLKPIGSWRCPLVGSVLCAGIAGAVASFFPLPPRYSYIPFQWLVPELMAQSVGFVADFAQSWLFAIACLTWLVSYIVFKVASVKNSVLQLFKKS